MRFFRTLRLKSFFHLQETIPQSDIGELAESASFELSKCRPTKHLALRELKEDLTLSIRRVDKGGAIVVMDTAAYVQEAYRQLNNTAHYCKLDADPCCTIQQEIKDLTETSLNGNLISKKDLDFLNVEFPRLPHLYLLPKIHKDLHNPPGRPIVS
uniref:Uncharacterized protein n=1 Tax=Leptobrachium leishanense TaxID=445787 RepID=A0A8C5LXF7_9ANUR